MEVASPKGLASGSESGGNTLATGFFLPGREVSLAKAASVARESWDRVVFTSVISRVWASARALDCRTDGSAGVFGGWSAGFLIDLATVSAEGVPLEVSLPVVVFREAEPTSTEAAMWAMVATTPVEETASREEEAEPDAGGAGDSETTVEAEASRTGGVREVDEAAVLVEIVVVPDGGGVFSEEENQEKRANRQTRTPSPNTSFFCQRDG